MMKIQRWVTASHDSFHTVGSLMKHVLAYHEAIRQIRHTRNYYVSCITLFHIIQVNGWDPNFTTAS